MTSRHFSFTWGGAALAVLFAIPLMTPAARAADVIYPLGSLTGLVPPAGMQLSKTFPGFENSDEHAFVIVNSLPAAAYPGMESSITDAALKKEGIVSDKREPMPLYIGNGTLVTGLQTGPDKIKYRKWFLLVAAENMTLLVNAQAPATSKIYSDSVIRAALATVTLRASVPRNEMLSLLPFRVGDLAGFRVQSVIPGRALLLTDKPHLPHLVATDGIPKYDLDARMVIAVVPSGPADNNDRSAIARMAFASISGIKDVQITMSEPVRIDNKEAFETVARAKDIGSDSDVMVVQWLRFVDGGIFQVVGMSRAEIWDDELTRMRAARDSIELK